MAKKPESQDPIPSRWQRALAILWAVALVIFIIYMLTWLARILFFPDALGVGMMLVVPTTLNLRRQALLAPPAQRGRPAEAIFPITALENPIAGLWRVIDATLWIGLPWEYVQQSVQAELCVMATLHLMRNGCNDIPTGQIEEAVQQSLEVVRVAPETDPRTVATVELAQAVGRAVEQINGG